MKVRAVIARAASETVALDDALEAFAFAHSGHFDLVTRAEDIHRNGIADVERVFEVSLRGDTRLLEMAQQRLVQPLGFHVAIGDLRRRITVDFDSPLLRDHAGTGLDDGAPDDRAIVVEELGHPQLCS